MTTETQSESVTREYRVWVPFSVRIMAVNGREAQALVEQYARAAAHQLYLNTPRNVVEASTGGRDYDVRDDADTSVDWASALCENCKQEPLWSPTESAWCATCED